MEEIFWTSSLNCVSLYRESVPRYWWEEVEGAAERPGMPRAGHCQFQPAPTAPAQGTAEPGSHGGGCAAQGGEKGLRRKGVQLSLGKGASFSPSLFCP